MLNAVLRGNILSYCANKRKERDERLAKITKELGRFTQNKNIMKPALNLNENQTKSEIQLQRP